MVSLHQKFCAVSVSEISQKFTQSDQLTELSNLVNAKKNKTSKVHLTGLVGSALSFTIASVFKNTSKPFLFILNDKEEAGVLSE